MSASHAVDRSMLFVSRFCEYGGFVNGMSLSANTTSGLHAPTYDLQSAGATY